MQSTSDENWLKIVSGIWLLFEIFITVVFIWQYTLISELKMTLERRESLLVLIEMRHYFIKTI